jgi:oxygen-independent coproporphyrinogen-3 oxidase
VQDFEPAVQAAIGRPQSFERTRAVVDQLRAAGVGSLNIDLLYGLPHQTPASLRRTLARVSALAPDRLALFGYAHVPWMSKRQKLIPQDALPQGPARRALLDLASGYLRASGYAAVGIDHFARPGDSLYAAQAGGRLRRNFQGYTDDQSPVLIGLGASAISQFPDGYVQNAAATHSYHAAIRAGHLPAARGHVHTPEDRARAGFIAALMCHFNAALDDQEPMPGDVRAALAQAAEEVAALAPDIAAFDGNRLRLLRVPAVAARTIASRFDAYLAGNQNPSAAV